MWESEAAAQCLTYSGSSSLRKEAATTRLRNNNAAMGVVVNGSQQRDKLTAWCAVLCDIWLCLWCAICWRKNSISDKRRFKMCRLASYHCAVTSSRHHQQQHKITNDAVDEKTSFVYSSKFLRHWQCCQLVERELCEARYPSSRDSGVERHERNGMSWRIWKTAALLYESAG